MWEIPACQVVDWTDVTEIVTAVCHHPDGKVRDLSPGYLKFEMPF